MAENLETIRSPFENGLRSDDRDVRGAGNSELFTNMQPGPFGARAQVSITVPISGAELSANGVTIAHPFPQLFIGKEVTLLADETALFLVDMGDWTLTAISTFDYTTPANAKSIASGGGPWHFMDFGTTWILFNGATVVFKSDWDPSGKTLVDETITTFTGCAFKGQGIMAGFNAGDYWSTAWTDFWNALPQSTAADSGWNLVIPAPGNNWVGWSSIGGGDLLLPRITPATFNTGLAEQLISNGNFLNGGTDWTLSGGDWVIANAIAAHTAPTASGVDTMTQSNANMLIALAAGDYWAEFDTVFTTFNLKGFKVGLGNALSAAITASGHYRVKLSPTAGANMAITPQQGSSSPSTVYPLSDIDDTGGWTFSAGTSPADVLNQAQSASDWVRATTTTSEWFRVKMNPITVGSGDTVSAMNLTFWDAHTAGGAGSELITVSLYNGSDLSTVLASYVVTGVAFGGETDVPNTSDNSLTSFTQAEMDSVTDWTNLVVKIAISESVAGTNEFRELFMDATVLENADSFTIDNITVTKDEAEDTPMAVWYAQLGQANFMPMDFQGSVLKVLPMRERVMVYGADGVSALEPKSGREGLDTPTFGLVPGVHRLGVASRDAAGGDLDEHLFVDTSGVAYKVNGEGKTERLGFEEFFLPLLGQQFTINFDPNRREYYITGDTGSNVECYHLTADNKLSKFHQLVSSVMHRDGGIIGIVEDDATPTAMVWKTNIIDLGYRELKYLSWVEVAYTNLTSVTATLHYRYNKASAFVTKAGIEPGPDGRFYIGVAAVEFQLELLGTTAAGAEIERIDFRYDTYDNRTARSPRGKPAFFR